MPILAVLGRGALTLFDEILPFGRWIRQGLTRLARWVGRNPLAALSISLAAACGLLWWHYSGEVAHLRKQIEARSAAEATAARGQAAANHEPAAKSADIARISNATAQSYYDAGRRAGAVYADAHRVRCPAGAAGAADLPGTDRAAALDDRPRDAPDVVAVSRATFDLLTGNSLRLAKVHEDADALIAAGVAVPAAEYLPH